MLQKETNYRHRKEYCPICKTHDHVIVDEHQAVTYCSKCGLVLIEPRLVKVTMEMEQAQMKEKYMRHLWKTKKHYQRD